MSLLASSASSRLPDTPNTRLHGRWLLLARVAWVAVSGLSLALFIGSRPAALAESATVCRTEMCSNDQLTPAAAQHLYALGISLDVFAWYILVLRCLFMLVFAAVGLVIFARAFADRTALVAAFTFLTFPITFTNVPHALPGAWWLPAIFVNGLGSLGISLLLFIFPDGRFVPRWTLWLWVAPHIPITVALFFPFVAWLPASIPFFVLGVVISLIAVQVYRYRRVSTPLQRQQTKWIVLGVAVGFGVYFITLGLDLALPDFATQYTLLYVINGGFTFLAPLLIPLSFGLALLRYRLWDVDALINKALVYGSLTGLLGALYAGLIIGLESLAGAFTGQTANNSVVLVISTLAMAALFLPLRRRIQALIDRRFYRKKYDAEKTLEAFSAKLRQQVDLAHIQEHLLSVVQETMQPAQVSLWLRQPEQNRRLAGPPGAGSASTQPDQ